MKKRILAVVCAVMLISTSAPIMASDIDIQSMSTEDLISLKKEISAELSNRNAGGDPIGEGVYIVGEDIKAGHYDFTAGTPSNYCVTVLYYENMDSYNNEEPINNDGNTGYLQEGVLMSLNLKDGQVLSISGGNGWMEATTPSWGVN